MLLIVADLEKFFAVLARTPFPLLEPTRGAKRDASQEWWARLVILMFYLKTSKNDR
jgi:hypothetical protein